VEHPVWLAIVAFLGIPAVTSGVTGAVKIVSAYTGISPKVIVYLVSWLVTGAVIAWQGPVIANGDPVAVVGEWLLWTTANAELARRLYAALWERLPGIED